MDNILDNPGGSITTFQSGKNKRPIIVKPARNRIKKSNLPASIISVVKPDDTLATLKSGEVVLNQTQQKNLIGLVGTDVFKQIGVPGFDETGVRRETPIPSFATGGVLNKKEAIEKLAKEQNATPAEARKMYMEMSKEDRKKLHEKTQPVINIENNIENNIETPPGGNSVISNTTNNQQTAQNTQNQQSIASSLRTAAKISGDLYTTVFSLEELENTKIKAQEQFNIEQEKLRSIDEELSPLKQKKQAATAGTGPELSIEENKLYETKTSEFEKQKEILQTTKQILTKAETELNVRKSGSKYAVKILDSLEKQQQISSQISNLAEEEKLFLKEKGIQTETQEQEIRSKIENYNALKAEQKNLKESEDNLNSEQKLRLETITRQLQLEQNSIETDIKTIEKLDELRNENRRLNNEFSQYDSTIKSLSKQESYRVAQLVDQITNTKQLRSAVEELSSAFGKDSVMTTTWTQNLETTESTLKSISTNIQNLSAEEQERLQKVVTDYVNYQTQVASLESQLKRGEISQEQYYASVDTAAKKASTSISSIGDVIGKMDLSQKITFDNMKTNIVNVGNSAKDATAKIKIMGQALDNLKGTGIPGADQLLDFIKNPKVGAAAGAVAVGTMVGAVVNKALKYAMAGYQAERELQKQIALDRISTEQQILEIRNKITGVTKDGSQIKDLLKTQKLVESSLTMRETIVKNENERLFIEEKSINQINKQLAQQSIQFENQAKLSFFGRGLKELNYTTRQLSVLGVSVGDVEQAFKDAANATGQMERNTRGMAVQKMASSMAAFSKITGASTNSLATINESLQRTDGLTAEAALNMDAGIVAMANKSGIADIAGLMEDIAGSAKNMLSYGINNTKSLAKQVIFAKSLGVSFEEIAQAGKNMVLNYQDSVRAEMELSVMLGEQVDLSEVRQAFATGGETEGVTAAIKEMQRLNLDITNMDIFTKNKLSEAFGLDLTSIQKIMTQPGVDIDNITPADIEKMTKEFAKKSELSMVSQEIATANLNADYVNIDAALQQKIMENLLFGSSAAAYDELTAAQAEAQVLQTRINFQISEALKTMPAYIAAEAAKTRTQMQYEMTNVPSMLEIAGTAAASTISSVLTYKAISNFGKKPGGPMPDLPDAPGGGKGFLKNAGQWIGKTWKGGKGGKVGLITAGLVALGSAVYAGTRGSEPEMIPGTPGTPGEPPQPLMGYQSTQYPVSENVPGTPTSYDEVLKTIEKQIEVSEKSIVNQTKGDKGVIDANINLVNQLKAVRDNLKVNIQGMQLPMQNKESGICSCAAAIIDVLKEQLDELREIIKGNKKRLDTIDAEINVPATMTSTIGDIVAESAFTFALSQASTSVSLAKEAIKSGQKITVGKAIVESFGKKALTGTLKSIGPQLAGTAVGVLADAYGDVKKSEGMAKSDMGTYNTGRASKVLGTTASWAATGAAAASLVGSFVPVVGNAIGAGVGAIIGGTAGLTYGLWDEYFSEDAKKQAEQIKNQAILNKYNETMLKTNVTSTENIITKLKEVEFVKTLSKDEDNWRTAMLSQTIEMTRLLDIVASSTLVRNPKGEGFIDKFGRVVKVGQFNKSEAIAAEAGITPEFTSSRERFISDILTLIDPKTGKIKTGSKTKYAGQSLAGKTLPEIMSIAGITQEELVSATEKQKLIEISKNVAGQQNSMSLVKAASTNTNSAPQGSVTNTTGTPMAGMNTGMINVSVITSPKNPLHTSIDTIATTLNSNIKNVAVDQKTSELKVVDSTLNTKMDVLNKNVEMMSENTRAIKNLTEIMTKIEVGSAAGIKAPDLLKAINVTTTIDGRNIATAVNRVIENYRTNEAYYINP